jgi:hypothetical protein
MRLEHKVDTVASAEVQPQSLLTDGFAELFTP